MPVICWKAASRVPSRTIRPVLPLKISEKARFSRATDPLAGSPAPAFRQTGKGQHEENRSENDRHAEHPAPGLGEVEQQVVDGVGDEDTDNDGELLERHQASAFVGRRHFRNIHRADDRVGPTAYRQQAEKDQRAAVGGQCAAQRRDDEQHGHGEEYLAAPVTVGESAVKSEPMRQPIVRALTTSPSRRRSGRRRHEWNLPHPKFRPCSGEDKSAMTATNVIQ